jgi:hypothetical protein
MSNLRQLRLQIVEEARNLRLSRDNHEAVKAQCEQRAIAAGANGKNAEERARNLTLALAEDAEYQHALTMLRDAEYSHERACSLLEAAKDDRRAAEWQIRAKLADGLFARGVGSDADDPEGDVAFDDVTDDTVDARLREWQSRANSYQGTTAEAASREHGRADPCQCADCRAARYQQAVDDLPF